MDGLEVETISLTPDAKGNVSIAVPEGMTPAPVETSGEFSGKSGDLMQDLALLAKERSVRAANPTTVLQPAKTVEPEQPATAPATPVPDKFKNHDGTVNEEKVAKSTHSAEEALAKYAEIERSLRQKQNEVAALRSPAPNQPPAQQAPVIMPSAPLNALERDMAQAIFNDAHALGAPVTEAQAIVQARAQIRIADIRYQADLNVTEQIRTRLDDQDRRTELEKIALYDPSILSPEGVEALSKIRQTRPHVNASPNPWTAAYREFLADQVISQRFSGQVQNPTPTAFTAKPPATPVIAAPRIVVKSEPNFNSMSSDQINAYAASLGPKGEVEFWRSRGLSFK